MQFDLELLKLWRRRLSLRRRTLYSSFCNCLGCWLITYTQLNHIHTLTRMLTSIRAAYLNIDTRTSYLGRQASRAIDLSEGSSLANIRHLTNEERDQIDLQARVILTRCS